MLMTMVGLPATLSCVLLLVCARTAALEGGRRALQDAPDKAPSPVSAPSGTKPLYLLRGVGTQNYTALLNGTYRLQGAVADLYDGTIKTGQHFFNAAGKPNWVIFDSATGAVQGTVVGAIKARATVQKQANDGGFGSVDALLIAASNGTGVLKEVAYIQRLNPLGGVPPTGLSGLPAYTDKIPNYPLAIPYQSGYVFLTGGQPNKEGGR